jgi:hypothetical protein
VNATIAPPVIFFISDRQRTIPKLEATTLEHYKLSTLLGLCFVAEGLQGRSGFIMSEQVSSDLHQKGRSSKDTKVDTAPKL